MEQIQGEDSDQSSAAWTLHSNMIDELKQQIYFAEDDTDKSTRWEKFMKTLSLLASEMTASETTPYVNDVDSLMQSLLEEDEIQIGNYSLVKTMLKDLHLHDCFNIIEKYENLINYPNHEQEGTLQADLSIDVVNPTAADQHNVYNILQENLEESLQRIRHLEHGEHLRPSKELREDYRESLNLVKQMADVFIGHDIYIETPQQGNLSLLFKYKSADAHIALWDMYTSGNLLSTLQSGIVTDFVLKECNVESAQLQVFLSSVVDDEEEEEEGEGLSFTGAQIPVRLLEDHRCTEHNDRKITMVCRDCDYQFVCPSCIAKKHCRHEFLELKDFIEDKKQHLSIVVEKAEMKYHMIEKHLEASQKVRTEHNRKINNSKEKLKERRNELMKIVDDWLNENTEDCEHIQLQSNARLDDVDFELQELLQDLATDIRKCKVTLTSSTYQDFESLESTLRSHLDISLPRIPHVEQADLESEISADKDIHALAGNLSIKSLVLDDDNYAVLHFCDIDAVQIKTEFSETYENITDIWKGSFDNSPALIKVYGGSPTTWEEFFSEALILRTLRHRQIIRFYGVCLLGDPVSMVMEYMSNGSLTRFLKNESSMTKQQLLAIPAQIADGMAFVSSEGIIHNFLAAQNILVGDVYTVKIANFSKAVRVANVQSEEASKTDNIKYPLKWTAPECLEGNATTKSDVWSFGVLLWETMSLGMIPYQETSGPEAVLKIKGGYRMSRPKDCEQPIYDIMLKCWNKSPTERPTFEFLYTFFDDYHVAAESVYGTISKTGRNPLGTKTRKPQDQKEKGRSSALGANNEQNSKDTATKRKSKFTLFK